MEDMPEEEASGISNRVDPEEIRRHDQWRKDNGIAVHYCFLLNQQSEPVGLTDVDVNLKLRDQVGQGITTVRRDYRGRGLARWLKAEMLAHLLGLHADCGKLITWMRTINEPIQKINAQLGYSLERQGRECMIKRHDLEMFASSSR